MEVISVWLIYHKASLDEFSPMNLDGSVYMTGVGVVSAIDMKTAIANFEKYLADNKMEMLELWKCVQWDSKDFNTNSFEDKQINRSASSALETGTIYYALGESSESIEFEGDDEND